MTVGKQMKRKYALFPYQGGGDYKAAQLWLDEMAVRGWVLERVRCFGWLAVFVPAEGRKHFVELDAMNYDDERNMEYQALCREAGWEFVDAVRGMDLFRSLPGADPAPLMTDPAVEAERILELSKHAWVGLTLLMALTVFFWWSLLRSGIPDLVALEPSLLLWMAALTAVAVWLIAADLRGKRDLRLLRGGAFRTPKHPRLVRVMRILYYPLVIVMAFCHQPGPSRWDSALPEKMDACPVVRSADLGVEAQIHSCYFLEGSSPAAARIYLYESLERPDPTDYSQPYPRGVSTYRYESGMPGLARWAVHHQMGREEQTWTAAELGFDGAWVGEGGHALAILQGDTAAVVTCGTVDLSEHIDAISKRLELD